MVKFIIFENTSPSGTQQYQPPEPTGSDDEGEGGGGGQPQSFAGGVVTRDEFRYIFQIAYELLNRITDLDLIGDPLIHGENECDSQFGCAAEYKLVHDLFTKSGEPLESCGFQTCYTQLLQQADIHQFFQIFKTGKISSIIPGLDQSGVNADSVADDAESLGPPLGKGQAASTKKDKPSSGKAPPNKDATQMENQVTNKLMKGAIQKTLHEKTIQKQLQHSVTNQFKQQQAPPPQEKPAPIPLSRDSMRVIVKKYDKVDGIIQDDGKDESGPRGHFMDNFNAWGLLPHQQKSPYCQEKMAKRVLEIRNENHKTIQINDLNENMQKMESNIELIQSKCLEFYSQRQILQFMRTLNSQRTAMLVPQEQGSQILQRIIEENTAMHGMEQSILTVKTTLRNTLDEYLQQSHSQLKYVNAQARAGLTHFFARGHLRGQKRALEKKKHKLLGQIQTLKSIFSSLFQENFDGEFLMKDRLYDQIYKKIHALYKSQIDHQFLIDFIDLKNKKRESKRFIDFLEGAKQQINLINQNNFLNYDSEIVGIPSIYSEAQSRIHEKYEEHTKSTHVKIMQKYAFMKMQICNYHINLGKLKAFNEIFQINTKGEDTIREMLTERIQKLRVKLERIDIELVRILEGQQIKQKINKEYFSSLGQISVIKCGKKGLDFKHIYDYMSMALIQHRTQESIWLLQSIKNNKDEKILYNSQNPGEANPERGLLMQKLSGESLASLIKLQKMKLIDKMFDCGETDSRDSGINYAKYLDILDTQTKNCQRFISELKAFKPLEESETPKASKNKESESVETDVDRNLSKFYELMGCEDQYEEIQDFQDNNPQSEKPASFEAEKETPEFAEMLSQLNQQDHFIFDFYPFTAEEQSDDGPPLPQLRDKQIISHMKSYSTSLHTIKFDEQRKESYHERRVAYKNVAQYLSTLIQYEEMEFEDLFKQQRDAVYNQAIEVLFRVNKKCFLNGFNLKFLSLPIEHSVHANYQAYRVIKMYLKEQMKSKIIADVSLVASLNEIKVPRLTQSAFNMQDLRLKEILENEEEDPDHFQVKRQQTSYALEQTYKSVYNLLNKSDSFERRSKQSFFKDLNFQLKHRNIVLGHKSVILTSLLEDLPKLGGDMFKIRLWLNQMVSKYIDERQLATSYDDFERAFSNHNKNDNKTQLASVLKGAMNYLQVLKKVLQDGTQKDTQGNQQHNNKNISALFDKLHKDISAVNTGLASKYAKQDQAVKSQKTAIASFIKRSIKANKGDEPPSPFKLPLSISAPPDELSTKKKMENLIMEQMIYLQTYQEILVLSRRHQDLDEFYQELHRNNIMIRKRKERIQQLLQYFQKISLIDEGSIEVQKQQNDQDNQLRGATIMNAVLSGNIFNSFDNYAVTNQQEQQAQSPPKLGTQISSPQPSSPPDAESSFLKTDGLISGEGTPNSRQISAIMNLGSTHSHKKQGKGDQVTTAQRVMNYLINFLSQICLQEDRFSSRRVLQDSILFKFGQVLSMEFQEKRMFMTLQYNLKHCLSKLISIYEIQTTSINSYLLAFDKQSKFVKNELFRALTEPNQQMLQSKFYHIICRTATSLTKGLINKIDEVFQEADLDDDEKTDFSNAQTKIRKKLDKDLRGFREYLDAESNKKHTEANESAMKQKEIQFTKCIAALGLLVRIYYLKQIQQQEDFCYTIEQGRKDQRLLTFQDEVALQDAASSQQVQLIQPPGGNREELKSELRKAGGVSVDKSK